MACYSFQRTLHCFANNFLVTRRTSNKLISFTKQRRSYSSNVLFKKVKYITNIDNHARLNMTILTFPTHQIVYFFAIQGFGRVSCSFNSDWCKVARRVSLLSMSTSAQSAALAQDAIFDSADHSDGLSNPSSSNGRVMLIDGTSIIYRAYYKLLGMSNHLL